MAIDEREKKGDSLVAQDRLLWEKVCRTTVPLHNKFPHSIPQEVINIGDKKQRITQSLPLLQGNQKREMGRKREKKIVAQTQKVRLLDHVTYRKIAKGLYPIEARIDLHGCAQEEAYFLLKNFLQSSLQRGLRYVLVITGTGRLRGSHGVLYQFVPHWLSTPAFRYYVHEFECAARHHGGDGALYVRLRRFVS
ncbi:Smr/MutS family protein [Bartonella sp. CB169]|uniref:Smr/MutS family protein n=1 Tax=Bartonella sp. CB169 TaxID=3112257 RepID=UPI00300E4215